VTRSLRLALAALALAPLAARAQEAPPAAAPQPGAPAARTTAIEEIVVTAQKRVENVQDIPVSVVAIGGDEVGRLKLTDTNDLAGLVPNLQANQINGDGTPVFSLRGVTMNDYSVHQSSPVAVYTDEVYAGPTVLQPIAMFDLERIEVLRGPQGTLYGRNTTGGAVNLITKAPDYDTEGYLTFGIGNFSRYEARGAAQVPVIDDTLAVRVAAYWANQDGWFKNEFPNAQDNNGTDEWAIRASALWNPTEDVDVILRWSSGRAHPSNYGIFADHIGKMGQGLGVDVYDLYNGLTTGSPVENPPDYTRAGLGKWELESNRKTNRKREVDQADLHVNWELTDSLTVTSVTAWSQGDFLNPEDTDGAPMKTFEIDYFGDGDQWSQDLRLTSSFGGPFEFVAGFYYATEKLDIATDLGLYRDIDFNLSGAIDPNDCADPLLASLGQPVSPDGAAAEIILAPFGVGLADFAALGCKFRNSFDQERRTIAGYFDGSYQLFEATKLIFGVRVTNDKTEVDDFTTFAEGAGVNLFDTIPSTDDSIDDTEPTWRVGIEQRFGEDILTYFTYSRGYRSGAFNGQAFFDPSEFTKVKPETLDSIELGAKSTLWEGKLQLNGSFFYYIYKDQQLIDVDPNVGTQILTNIDESKVKGIEIEALSQITEDIRLSAGVGWLHGEVDKGTANAGTLNLKGDTLPNSPDWNVHLAADWDFLHLDRGTASFHLDAGYTGAQFFTLPHESRDVPTLNPTGKLSLLVDDYWLMNTSVRFVSSDDRWELAFWVKNLTDEWYQTSIVGLQGIGGYDYTHIGPPRQYGGEVTLRF
jgi:iron complex outermembrane receptor protein